jgi:hypothetical protein
MSQWRVIIQLTPKHDDHYVAHFHCNNVKNYVSEISIMTFSCFYLKSSTVVYLTIGHEALSRQAGSPTIQEMTVMSIQ